MVNNNGPRTESWGTPEDWAKTADLTPKIWTNWVLPEEEFCELRQIFTTSVVNFYNIRYATVFSWTTMSKSDNRCKITKIWTPDSYWIFCC